eukprot:425209_1
MNNSSKSQLKPSSFKLWKSTTINPNNMNNVYLYIRRPTSSSTTPISVQPSEYLSTLRKHHISVDSLNIPTDCPTFENEHATKTSKILWNMILCQSKPINTSTTHQPSDENNALHNKLNWIMNMLGYKDMQKTMQYLNYAQNTSNKNNGNEHIRSRKRTLSNVNNYHGGLELKRRRKNKIQCTKIPRKIKQHSPTKQLLWTLDVPSLKTQYLKPHNLVQKGPKYVLINRIYEHYNSIHGIGSRLKE